MGPFASAPDLQPGLLSRSRHESVVPDPATSAATSTAASACMPGITWASRTRPLPRETCGQAYRKLQLTDAPRLRGKATPKRAMRPNGVQVEMLLRR